MKFLRLFPLILLLTAALRAASGFPGLQSLLSDAEWKRAGLDHLTPDQIGVIDAALIRHAAGYLPVAAVAPAIVPAPVPSPAAAPAPAAAKPGLLGRLGWSKSRGDARPAPPDRVEPRVAATPPASVPPAEPARARVGVLERFGLSKPTGDDWRSQPPLVAHFVMWTGGNRFQLDNGQVWEGLEQIVLELPPGREVIIEARPLNGFAMKLDDRSAVVRVQRVK